MRRSYLNKFIAKKFNTFLVWTRRVFSNIAGRMFGTRTLVITVTAAVVVSAGIWFGIRLYTLTPAEKDRLAESAINTAQSLEKAGKPAEAIKALETAISRDNNNLEIKTTLAALYYSDKQFDKSADLWQEAAKEKTDDPVIHNSFGNALRDAGKTDEAAAAYKLAIEKGNADSLPNLVTLYNSEGKYADSLAILNERKTKYPNDPVIKQLLASTKYKESE